jgi:hypothetical protein
MAADLVVLDGDLVATAPEEIVDLPIGMTFVGGEVVHDAISGAPAVPASATMSSTGATMGLAGYMSRGCCHT